MIEKYAYRVSLAVVSAAAIVLLVIAIMAISRAVTKAAAAAEDSKVTTVAGLKPVPDEPLMVEQDKLEDDLAKLPDAAPDSALLSEMSETGNPAAGPSALLSKLPLSNDLTIKRVLTIDEPFVHGYYKWDDKGVPDGEIVVTVDLKAESISVFRGGYEIGAAVITFGDAEKPTPTGVFPITQKNKDHVSNIYGSSMPYMMRLTNDGVAIHATDVKWGWGTRGCIGVPLEFARLLFEQAKIGDRVIITNGKILDVANAGAVRSQS